MTSLGCSTTQMVAASRRSSWQMRQVASVARLKQTSQCPTGGLDLANRVGEGERLLLRRAEDVERQPLGGALADARQAAELGDEPVDGSGEQGV